MKTKILLFAGCFAFAAAGHAAVIYDENGVGFVGKGDVQTIYDWNNTMLQDNAHLVRFRMLVSGSASWTCTGVNPAGKTVTQSHSTESESVDAAVSFDARKNRVGQVTGFVLNGAAVGSTEYAGVGVCPTLRNWLVQPSLDQDSLVYEGSADPLLQISIDGQEWYDLPITE
jgi:hypothetical protein